MIVALILLQQLGNGPTVNMQMPDPKRLSGIPLPAPDLAPGTVRVRVVRGEMTDVVPGAIVELEGGGTKRTAKADETGHATFTGLSAREEYKVSTTVDGKHVESHTFAGPQQGGLKFMLVLAAAGGGPPVAPAEPQVGSGPTINMNMPDPKRISGIPLPAPDLPAGAIRVRTVRDEISAMVPDSTVELLGEDKPRKDKTDQTGHVMFQKLKAGVTYKLRATIEGKVVESRPFQAPQTGGFKFMLVEAAAGQAPEAGGEEEEQGGEAGMPAINPLRGQPAKPDDKIAPGTVEARISGPDGKPIVGQKVTLVSVGKDQKLSQRDTQTDAKGVAKFDKIPASADVGYLVAFKYEGVPYNSAPFKMPDKPGLSVELRAFPPTKDSSQVLLGPATHIVMLVEDERLDVMENLVIENRGDATWDPGPSGLFFELPAGVMGIQNAGGEDAPPQFKIVEKKGVAWMGPVPPGRMQIRFAFGLPLAREITFAQKMPLAMESVHIITDRIDDLVVDGPVVQAKKEIDDKGRKLWLLGQDDKLAAGGTVELTLHNLPLPDKRGAWAALAISLCIGLWGFVMAREPARASAGDKRRKLEERREKLLGELVTLEEQRAAGRIDEAKWKPRREDLVGSLERVYRELDAEELG